VLAIVIALAIAWYLGKLDRYLPEAVRSTTALGAAAPAAVAGTTAPAGPAQPAR